MSDKISINDLLAGLEAEEKTAEEVFARGISEEKKEVAPKQEKTASTDGPVVKTTPQEKVASEPVGDANLTPEELVKIAKGMGQVMAYSCYSELVNMGVMPPTNGDMEFPRVSEVSLPSESPVTVAADAQRQVAETRDKIASAMPDILTAMHTKYFREEN